MDQMNSDGLIDSTPRIKAFDKKEELWDDWKILLNKLAESERLAQARKELDGPYVDFNETQGQDYAELITKRMADVRQQILDAQKNGDDEKATLLLSQLTDLKRNYNDADIILRQWQINEKKHLEETEDLLSGADKVNYGLEWAEKYRKMIADTSQRPEYRSGKDLFKDANKTIDDLVSDLKKVPLDKVNNNTLDNLFSGTAKKLNNNARAIWQKSEDDELAKQLPQESKEAKKRETTGVPTREKVPPAPQKDVDESQKKEIEATRINAENNKLIWDLSTPTKMKQKGLGAIADFDYVMENLDKLAKLYADTKFYKREFPDGVASKKEAVAQLRDLAQKITNKPALEPIPSTNVNSDPLHLYYYPTLNGKVGQAVNVQYKASGGLAPYHFQLETMGGFPPHGVIFDANGLLSGTPSAAGTYTFRPCVVDTTGKSFCQETVMTVLPASPPSPPATELKISLSNISCAIADGSYGCGGNNYWRSESGLASGPVGTRVVGQYVTSCGSWALDSASFTCTRRADDPEETQWTFRSCVGVNKYGEPFGNTTYHLYSSRGERELPINQTCP